MRKFPLLVLAAVCAPLAVTQVSEASPQSNPTPLQSHVPAPAHADVTSVTGERVLEVKFAHASHVAVRSGRVDATGAARTAASMLNGSKVDSVQPLFALSETQLDQLTTAAAAASGRAQADLNQWLQVTVARGVNAEAFARSLSARPEIETAYVRPAPVAPPSPDYTERQGYLFSPEADYGINAAWAHQQGATGEGVTIADVEFGWNYNHEDLTKLRGAVLTKGTPQQQYIFHGTSVMGEMVADKNGFGVTGIAHGADARLSHVSTRERGFAPASAIATAAAALSSGDVMVIELQTNGCRGGGGGGGYVAEEWIPSVFDAIKAATSKGIHVVEAAGNGSEDLDSSCYGSTFPSNRGDSGAIIVGAGAGKVRNGSVCGSIGYRQSFSTHGSRVNAFAWGRCVMTTDADSTSYTSSFSGTSSATPIVAGAVAVISAEARSRGIEVSPAQMRQLITETGTQARSGQKIGAMPDLKKAFAQLFGDVRPTPTPTPTVSPTPTPTPTASPTPTPTVSPTLTPSVDPTDRPTPTPTPSQSLDPTTRPTPTASPTPTPSPSPTPGANLLVNGDFEAGTRGWSGDTGVINSRTYDAHSGSLKAYLLGYHNKASETLRSSTFRVPSDGATLRFFLQVRSHERTTTKAYDAMAVRVRTGDGTFVESLRTWSNLDENNRWEEMSVDLGKYADKEIMLSFDAAEDASLTTVFLVDDVVVS